MREAISAIHALISFEPDFGLQEPGYGQSAIFQWKNL
jgi:hypothetical protein